MELIAANNSQTRYGCFNHAPFKDMVEWKGKPFPFTMSHDCHYDKPDTDSKCQNCIHAKVK